MNLLSRLIILRASVIAALFFTGVTPALRAEIDLDGNGTPDIWALRYSAEALTAVGDVDGDGQNNAAEGAAGTNPFQPGDVIKVTTVARDGSGVHLTFSTQLGKRYRVQKTAALSGASTVWTNVGSLLTPDASNSLTATDAAPGAGNAYYRVRVEDVDSDGDGVNDWEEMQIGYDPYNTHSKGLNGPDDLTLITGALVATTNVLSVTSSGVPISEPSAPNVSTDVGVFTITRTGKLNAITVNYSVGGGATAGSDYVALTGSVSLGLGVNSATVSVTPLPDAVLESPEAVILSISANPAYSFGSSNAAAVLINDYTQASGSGLMGQFWEEGSGVLDQTRLPTFTGTPTSGVVYPGLDETTAYWSASTSHPAGLSNDGYWSSRWTGEILPEFSQVYTFSLETNFAGRLYVDGQLVVNNWPPNAVLKSSSGSSAPTTNRVYGTIDLAGGVRHPIIVEHYQDAGSGRCYLRWQSSNQPEQYIPAARLFPTAPPQILGSLNVLLLKNSPLFSYQITASANPTSYSAANLPPGWAINTATGVVSGVPTQVGTWQIPITASNAVGSGSAILQINVIATDGGITREVWTGVGGGAVSDTPVNPTPNSTSTLNTLEGPQNAGDSYWARIRGYITAPTTGAYKFWLAADHAAELWISDDDDRVNAFLRASLTAPIAYRDWANASATPLLWLEAGHRYYVEVRHKEDSGNDHISVGWLKPGETGTTPGEIVPGYALSQYVEPAPMAGESTLYATSLTAEAGVTTGGYGSSTLRLSADETVATLTFNYANLTTAVSGKHIHAGNHGGNIVFDIDDATPNQDGSYTWIIAQVGAITVQDILNEIRGGTAYLNIHTARYPAGEIKGYYALQAASQTFTPPPPAPAWADDHSDANAASRFLLQATFGPTLAEIGDVQALGYEAWIDKQFNPALKPVSYHYPYVFANRNTTNPNGATYYTDLTTNAWWKNSIEGTDQLRQRVALALSEILVVSTAGPLEDNAQAVSSFYDKLLDDAFDNFRKILEDVTLTPAMGIYLDMRRNDKPNLTTGSHPNENYAREIKQLFSIGLNRMHPDGSLVLNSKGELIPTYGQDEIVGFAHAFTGWDYKQDKVGGLWPTGFAGTSNYLEPMTEIPAHHFTGQKRILNRVVLPGLPTVGGQALDPYATHTPGQINDPAYQALPAQELDATHDALFNHPNCPPFICRQLIQRLVTSTPSRGYVYRVVSKFINNGSGVRGDMKTVIKAILLDYEARSPQVLTQQGHGKQREPMLRVTAIARAFVPPPPIAGTYTQDGGTITVTTSPVQHRLVSGNPVTLAFSGAGTQSTSGDYALSGTFPPGLFTFTVRTKDVFRGTYTQTGTTVTVTTPSGHGFTTDDSAYVRFRDGPGKPADALLAVTVVDATRFTADVPTTATISTPANCDIAYLRGQYDQRGTTVTLTTTTTHGLTTGNIAITFVGAIGQGSFPADGTYPVTVVDDTHLTITVADSVSRTGTFNAGPDTPLLNRSGSASTIYSSWTVGNTETDIAQTPLRSPTVFNFFLPDYQFPGIIANAGLITPEFELTSETNVIRQANFLFNGIFNPSTNTGGISSFRSGNGNIAVDFSPWMGNKPGGTTPWTNDVNLEALIDQLNILLMGGLLPSTGDNNYAANPRVIVNAKQAIKYFVTNTGNIPYSNLAPTDAQKRDRIRSIVHLIVTSPDFTIQK